MHVQWRPTTLLLTTTNLVHGAGTAARRRAAPSIPFQRRCGICRDRTCRDPTPCTRSANGRRFSRGRATFQVFSLCLKSLYIFRVGCTTPARGFHPWFPLYTVMKQSQRHYKVRRHLTVAQGARAGAGARRQSAARGTGHTTIARGTPPAHHTGETRRHRGV